MFESAQLGRKVDRETFVEREPILREALLDAQLRLASADFSVVVVVAGAEGAGKGETVNLLLNWLDARGVETHALGAPSEEEEERPEYFRFWRRLPRKGRIAIFFGSWYTRPITQHSLGKLSEGEMEESLRRIVEFETMLEHEGVLIVKLWLHVTKKQQKKRFNELADNPQQAWRVTKQDWRFHKTYKSFVDSASLAIRRTGSGQTPWHIIEAWDSRYRHLTVAETLLSAIEQRLAATTRKPESPVALPVPETVNVISALDLGLNVPEPSYRKEVNQRQVHLGFLARQLRDRRRSVVLVFEGSDASGKGGSIRRLTQALDARFYQVVQIAAPTDEELDRPYLWRFWRNLPRRGSLTFFDRSWYGRVLVERIEGFCAPADWQRAYGEINAFEEELISAGSILLKFWFATSKEEQLRRFQQREALGFKHYKITDDDWRNREKWEAYEAAACEMIERTSSELAPWTLVEAEDKYFARLKVLRTVEHALMAALKKPE
ncbi:MAG TPA: polyphosphate:AMP phosphotransferase [Verrucomicrobiales bacterium]|nr:polyphosphate:AMP phosphotransferase [Verrucomicrobiales bacterium]